MRTALGLSVVVLIAGLAPSTASACWLDDDCGNSFDVRLGWGVATEAGAPDVHGVTMDAIGMARFRLPTQDRSNNLTLLPEAGFSLLTTDISDGAFFVGGVGLGWSFGPVVIGAVPSLVTGSYENELGKETALGIRGTALMEIKQVVGVQVSHQVFQAGSETYGQTMFTASLHLVPLLIIGAAMGS